MELRKATRQKAKLRIGISAPSGFGKTYSALLLANGITGDWNKVAVIDTENGSGELYSHLGEYNVLPLEAPYNPERYIEAIKACESAGMEVIIIDSISHEWEGKGGCLEIQEKLGGRYQDWAKVTPRHQAFIDAILTSKSHIITTVRRKQDYDMVKEGNSTKVVKAGLKEVTREGFEYELTLNLEIINDKHLAKASKDRTGLFADKPEAVLTVAAGQQLREWAETGLSILEMALNEVEACTNEESTIRVWNKYPNLKDVEKFKNAVGDKGRSFKAEQEEPAAEQIKEPVERTYRADGKAVVNGKTYEEATPEEREAAKGAPDKITAAQQEKMLKLVQDPAFSQKAKDNLIANISKYSFKEAEEGIATMEAKIKAAKTKANAA